jgi:hypothetical protein
MVREGGREGGRTRTGVVEVGLVSSDNVSGVGRHGDCCW